MTRKAFTLLETLLVIGIISVLLAMLFPAVQMVRATSERMQCAKNMNQIGLALHLHHADHGRLPLTKTLLTGRFGFRYAEYSLAWPVFILPYLEQRALFQEAMEAIRVEEDPHINPPHLGYARAVRAFVCPTDSRLLQPIPDLLGFPTGLWSYVGNRGRTTDGVLARLPGVQFSEIRDGLSNTLMAGERPPPETLQSGRWYTNASYSQGNYIRDNDTTLSVDPIGMDWDPICTQAESWKGYSPGRTDWPCDRLHYWSMHPGGANFLFCDNAVRFIPYSAKGILPALASRNNDDVAELPD